MRVDDGGERCGQRGFGNGHGGALEAQSESGSAVYRAAFGNVGYKAALFLQLDSAQTSPPPADTNETSPRLFEVDRAAQKLLQAPPIRRTAARFVQQKLIEMTTGSPTLVAERSALDGPLLIGMNPGLGAPPAVADALSLRDDHDEPLPLLWQALAQRLSAVLLAMPSPDAAQSLDATARQLVALVERDPDLAIFQVVRSEHAEATPYGVVRSLHAAAAAWLVAARLGWSEQRGLTLVKAAFTMNLGVLALQERLSNQARLPSPAQRHSILMHPITSAATLRASGIADAEWLQAVEQHHEKPGGGGYPRGIVVVCEMANALRAVDVYTAKLAGRSGRDSLPPERAARDLLVVERGNAFALALVTEFGMHPPGSLVRLHNGEVGYVVERTADTASPRVAVVTSRRGEPLSVPVLRATEGREFGIAGPAIAAGVRAPMSAERLYS
jgi:hypothetical protein